MSFPLHQRPRGAFVATGKVDVRGPDSFPFLLCATTSELWSGVIQPYHIERRLSPHLPQWDDRCHSPHPRCPLFQESVCLRRGVGYRLRSGVGGPTLGVGHAFLRTQQTRMTTTNLWREFLCSERRRVPLRPTGGYVHSSRFSAICESPFRGGEGGMRFAILSMVSTTNLVVRGRVALGASIVDNYTSTYQLCCTGASVASCNLMSCATGWMLCFLLCNT